jgi:hypothetical protein
MQHRHGVSRALSRESARLEPASERPGALVEPVIAFILDLIEKRRFLRIKSDRHRVVALTSVLPRTP